MLGRLNPPASNARLERDLNPPEPRRWMCWMCHENVERADLDSIDCFDEAVCKDCAEVSS